MPALVTFRDRAMADAVLPASIRSCLGVGVPIALA